MSDYNRVKGVLDTVQAVCGGFVSGGKVRGMFSYDDGVVYHGASSRVIESVLKKPKKLDRRTVGLYNLRFKEAKDFLSRPPNPDMPPGKMASMVEQQEEYGKLLNPKVELMHISQGPLLYNMKKEYSQSDGKLTLTGDVWNDHVGSIFDPPREYDSNSACVELVDRIHAELRHVGVNTQEGDQWTIQVGDIARIRLIGHIFDSNDRRRVVNGVWYNADITEVTPETLSDTLAQVAPIYNIAAHTIRAFYNPELKGYQEHRMDKVFGK